MQPRITITGRTVCDAHARIEAVRGAHTARVWVEVLLQVNNAGPVFRCVHEVGAGPAAQIAARSMAHHLRQGSCASVSGAALAKSRAKGAQLDITTATSITNHSLRAPHMEAETA